MQLRQAELVGAVHDDGVGGWHVNAGFDNRCAQQDVEALRDEIAHHFFQVALMHLAWAMPMRASGSNASSIALRSGCFDFVVQEVDLAAALQFAQACLADG